MPAERMQRRLADPGLQPERTSLAWFRTFLCYGALLVLSLRHSQHQTGIMFWAIFSLMATVLLVFSRFARSRNLMQVAQCDFMNPREVWAKWLVTLAVSGLALLFAFVHAKRFIFLSGGL